MQASSATLARLISLSKRNPNSAVSDLPQILEVARSHNRSTAITGLLCFNGEYFLQVMEGAHQAINSLYSRILRDSRHSDAQLLSYDDLVETRIFSDWDMGYVHSLDLDPSVLAPFFPEGRFEPRSLDSTSALRFLVKVREHLRIARKSPGAEALQAS
jgi:hypothetical protein